MTGITVLGSRAFVQGFRLAGVRDTHEASSKKDLEDKLQQLLSGGKSNILVMMDSDYNALPVALRRRAGQSIVPVVISIGKLDEESLREKIKKAIGIDLYRKG